MFAALTFPNIDPVALSVPLPFLDSTVDIHWYGIMYLLGFGLAWAAGRYHARRAHVAVRPAEVDDLILYGAVGVVLGGRLGYVLFYAFPALVHDPLMILRVWEGGMSFHGGLLGVLIALALYGWRTGHGFFRIADFAAALTPIGLFFGRIGNFIGGELWGRPADPTLPWAMVFPHVDSQPRHPSQLYEALLEGVLLFLIVWAFASRPRPTMAVSGLFALGYGVFRFGVEFVREPDAHIGYIAFGWLTMGQILSAPLIIVGLGLLAWAYWRDDRETAA